MSVYIFALFMGSLAAFTAILFRERFEQVLPCCICYVILVLYISGLIGNFVPGLWLIWLTLPLAGILCLVRSRKRLVADIRAYVLTPGLFFMLIAYGAMIPCILKMHINSWDEFSHWGRAVKNFWYLNDFANLENSTTNFKGYPPAATLFAYFAQRFGGHYVECKSYAAYDFFYLALMSPYFCVIKRKKDLPKAIVLGFCCILLPTLVWNRVYDVTYVDALLGMETALIFAAYLLYEDKKWRNITIFLITIVLCLTKASGAGLAAIALIILVVAEWKQLSGKFLTEKGKEFVMPGIMLGGILLGKYSWDIYLKASGTAEAWNISELNVANLLELMMGKGPAYRYETIRNFFRTVAFEPISESIWPMSCLGWIVLFIISGMLVVRYLMSGELKNKYSICIWSLVLGIGVYGLSLLLLYLFTYSEPEALSAASFGRYMGTWLEIVCAVFLMIVLKEIKGKQQWGMLLIILVMSLTTYLPIYKAIATATPVCTDVYKNWPVDIRFSQVKETLDECGNPEAKVYFIHQNDSGYWEQVCGYGITPYQMQNGMPFSFGSDSTITEWVGLLKEGSFTHVLLNYVDDSFAEIFGELFMDEDAFDGSSLFEIVNTDKGIRLKKIKSYY